MTTSPVASISDDELNEITAFTDGDYAADFEEVRGLKAGQLRRLIARLRAAEQDVERIEWLDRQVEAYGFQDTHEGNRWAIDGPFSDLRRAIDICMEQQP